MIKKRPQARLTLIAVGRESVKTGIKKVEAMISFVKKVAMVASQISL